MVYQLLWKLDLKENSRIDRETLNKLVNLLQNISGFDLEPGIKESQILKCIRLSLIFNDANEKLFFIHFRLPVW